MNPKHHVSLPIAKQLAEAGIVIESEFWWKSYFNGDEPMLIRLQERDSNTWKMYPAPIATEILERRTKYCWRTNRI